MLSPARLLCALAVTAPRTHNFQPSEEKGIFYAAIYLQDGYNRGQKNGLDPIAFT